jgi:hypothetical protein
MSPLSSTPPLSPHQKQRAADLRSYLTGYFWFILKNVIGWILIILAWPVGVIVPGPGGIPLFLIGFALVAFPGKRRLTSRVMRGKPFDLEARIFTVATTFVAVVLTAVILWLTLDRYTWLLAQLGLERTADDSDAEPAMWIGVGLLALAITWATTRLALRFVNFTIRAFPIGRRMVRPWLRRRGVRLLPTRRKRILAGEGGTVLVQNDEILEFDERHQRRLSGVWSFLKPWLRRMAGILVTLAIFYYLLRPLYLEWDAIRPRIGQINWLRFTLGVGMFAAFLFVFRTLTWWRILASLGHRLPIPATTRIWSTSELARYLPGVIWQVVGRVWLVKPYGVRGSVCSTSQILELILFLLANVLVAVTSLLFFGYKQVDGAARWWLLASMAMVPVLSLLIHPRVFHALSGRLLRSFRKPPLARVLPSRVMYGLLAWAVLGLLWQSLAVWLTIGSPLGLIVDKWWIVAGAYCLAWIAGFLAVWAPGGLGVRELVFMLAIKLALPEHIRAGFATDDAEKAFLAFLAVLLRLWATAGELVVASIAYALDWRGATGDPTAPGRVAPSSQPAPTPVEPVRAETSAG